MRGSSKFCFFGETIMYVGRYIGMDVKSWLGRGNQGLRGFLSVSNERHLAV